MVYVPYLVMSQVFMDSYSLQINEFNIFALNELKEHL